MKFLFLFLDGVGLGRDDPSTNPFARAPLPFLETLLEGHRLTVQSTPLETSQTTLLALDATLGVAGLPQSATGQAVLLTGQNVPAILGYHYGPKPNPAVAKFLQNGNLFNTLITNGLKPAFLNAYPEPYFEAIQSGRRIFSAIPLAATHAGLRLNTTRELFEGRALSADFTGQGWRENLGLPDTPLLTPIQAGQRLAALAQIQDFSFFEYWLSDYAGHKQDMQATLTLLTTLDQVLAGLVNAWPGEEGLILVTSDHGNLEDLSTRKHTLNPVPAILIGKLALRQEFARNLHNLADIAPAIKAFFRLGP